MITLQTGVDVAWLQLVARVPTPSRLNKNVL